MSIISGYRLNQRRSWLCSVSKWQRRRFPALDQANTVCCYARSDKYWINDPQGIAWETLHTLDSARVYGK